MHTLLFMPFHKMFWGTSIDIIDVDLDGWLKAAQAG